MYIQDDSKQCSKIQGYILITQCITLPLSLSIYTISRQPLFSFQNKKKTWKKSIGSISECIDISKFLLMYIRFTSFDIDILRFMNNHLLPSCIHIFYLYTHTHERTYVHARTYVYIYVYICIYSDVQKWCAATL